MRFAKGTALGIISSLAFAAPVFAQTNISLCPVSGTFGGLCGLEYGKFGTYVGTLVSLVLAIAVIVALFFLVWGGIKWITSGGDKTGVEGARNTIIAAIVGLIIAFLAYLIINFVGGFFGINLFNLILPSLNLGK